MSDAMNPLVRTVAELATASSTPCSQAQWDDILAAVTKHFDCPVGTVHMMQDDGLLHLRSQIGLPPPVLDKVQIIPVGKGMAGIAAERKEAVQVCNLQQDDSGVVRPGAKQTKMEGSIAVPMLVGDEVRGVLGIAKPTAYDFPEKDVEVLRLLGAMLAGQ